MRLTNLLLSLLLLTLSLPVNGWATDAGVEKVVATVSTKGTKFENKYFRLRLLPRTPNQIAAFYEARGFPTFAIDEVRKACFITVGLGNRSKDKLYHDLSDWKFVDKSGPVKRILRSDWKQRWIKLGLEKRFQSTFRWTLMPEKLDFYPQEGEGGNIIFPRTGQAITIIARVQIGEDKSNVYEVTFKDVECAKDPS